MTTGSNDLWPMSYFLSFQQMNYTKAPTTKRLPATPITTFKATNFLFLSFLKVKQYTGDLNSKNLQADTYKFFSRKNAV